MFVAFLILYVKLVCVFLFRADNEQWLFRMCMLRRHKLIQLMFNSKLHLSEPDAKGFRHVSLMTR